MAYDYVRRVYGVNPGIGAHVRHTVTNKLGQIARENPSQGHYVMVRFGGQKFSVPCHPTELDYAPASPPMRIPAHADSHDLAEGAIAKVTK